MKVKHNTIMHIGLRRENSVDVMDLYFDSAERENKTLSIPPTPSPPVAFTHSQPISITGPKNVCAPHHNLIPDCFEPMGSPKLNGGSPLSWSQPISLHSSTISENEPLTTSAFSPPMIRRHNSFSLGHPGDNLRSWVKHMKPKKP